MSEDRRPVFHGLSSTAAGILAGRLLGLLRDLATAACFGLAAGGILDALVLAFRVPNLFRRLFGEGALTASYVPVLANRIERQGRDGAGQFAGGMLFGLAAVLLGLLIIGEAICGLAIWGCGDRADVRLVFGLTAVMLSYLVFICLTAQASATLQAWGQFRLPAFSSSILNIVWLAAVWGVAPCISTDKTAQAYVLAVCILLAGAVQFFCLWPAMTGLGVRLPRDWSTQWKPLGEVINGTLPVLLGVGVTQLNTLCDSLIAWMLSASPDGPATIGWLGGVEYPLQAGAAAAIYYGERLYQFPVGILGVTVATVVFPAFSRHAARGREDLLARDLTAGLRLVLYLGIPASVGLCLLAEPIASLLLERGNFTSGDTLRAARMIRCYSVGVWAYCCLGILVRGYYALKDPVTPVRVGASTVALNLTLNLTLIWPLAEAGLAISTAVCAVVQAAVLARLLPRIASQLEWRALAATTIRSVASAAGMILAVEAVFHWLPEDTGWPAQLWRACVPAVLGGASYLLLQSLLGGREGNWLLGQHPPAEPSAGAQLGSGLPVLSPFAPAKGRSFAERKTTMIDPNFKL